LARGPAAAPRVGERPIDECKEIVFAVVLLPDVYRDDDGSAQCRSEHAQAEFVRSFPVALCEQRREPRGGGLLLFEHSGAQRGDRTQ
jgi:hypothetical protein